MKQPLEDGVCLLSRDINRLVRAPPFRYAAYIEMGMLLVSQSHQFVNQSNRKTSNLLLLVLLFEPADDS
jgi:hypothetical protein